MYYILLSFLDIQRIWQRVKESNPYLLQQHGVQARFVTLTLPSIWRKELESNQMLLHTICLANSYLSKRFYFPLVSQESFELPTNCVENRCSNPIELLRDKCQLGLSSSSSIKQSEGDDTMLDGCPRRRNNLIQCEVGVLTVIKGVGELRYNTFTKQEVMHVFLWV